SSNGHFECLFEINYGLNIDDIRNKLTLSMEFTFAKSYDTTKINLAVRVTKPITDINLQFTVSYLSSGPETNVRSIIRYATGKDIHITLDLKIPRSALTFIEAKLNVTLPTFHPMVLDLQLHEKTPNEYNIDVTASWFSGHTVTAKGLYQDKSTHKASSHNVKLLLKSPSFEEIAASYKYLRDETEFKVELTADHAKDKYYIILKHANPQPSDYETSIELRIKSQVYSLLTVVSLLEHRQITAQLHIDRIRDIHFMLRSLNQPDRKEASMEVKWDANRDPSQKVAVAVQYLHPESMNYSGYVMVSYPGRTIRGNYLFALKDSRCESSAHLEWSPRDSIQITVGAIYEYEDILMLALKSELLTPFESWKRTSLSAGIRHHDNLVQANASVYWHDDQNVALNLYGDYMLSDEEFSCELNASIISTIPQVSSMSGSFSHKQSNNKYDTLLYVQHYPQKAISIKSTWQLEEDENSSNLTGVVNLQSPYPGYNEGMMRCRMHVNSAWDVKGAADLIIDRRKYTFQINGYVKKLTDNMLVFEITTPMENYSKITGRFGYSGERKHLVAEISSPHAQIGIEILFQFQNTNNFDIKFNVATPIEFLQKAILVAKLEEETVDFRCGWNNLTIGFFGQWHYENITDFEYCYKIFTPLEGFHENGVIAKLIKHEGLDFSLGFNVGDKKLGLKVYGASNPAPPPDLKLATKQLYDDEAYDDEDEELINWKGSIEVDTFFHPTLKGTLEIEEKDTTYIVASTLTLPNGTAVLLDELDFEDVFTISNKFHLKTPYPQFEEIHSTYDYKIDLGVQFKTAVYVAVLHNKQWKEAGASVNYTYDGEDDSALQTWTASVNIFSPFDLLKFYLVQGVLEVEGTVYRTNVTMSTSDSRLTSTGFLQADKDYFESALSFGMVSPVYTIPSLRISGKRDFTQPEKRIELMLESLHPLAEMYKFQGHWNLQSRQNFGLGMTLNTPYESMPSATFGVAYRMANDNSTTQLNIILSPLPQHTWKLDSIVIGDQISTDLETPIENYSKLALNGTLTSDKENSYTIKGTLKCENRIYTVDGSTSANAESPLQAELTLADQNDGSVILIHANIKPVENGFNLSCGMQNGKENFDLQGHLRMKNLLDFNYFVKATSTHATYSLIYFDGTVFQISDGNITGIFNADTSLPGYRKIRFFSNISLKEQAGALKTSLETETVNTRFNLEWALKLFENILLAFDGHYQDPEITKSGTLKVFFAFPRGKGKNPRKDVSLGAYVNLDKDAWLFGSNATLSFSTSIEDIDVQAHVILPPPRYDIHSFQGQMHFNEKFDDLKFLAKYKTAITKKNYGLSSRYLVKNDNINGNVQMEFGPGQLDYINNVFNVRRDNTTVEGTYVLTTPLYEENTLRATALYKVLPEFNIVRAQLFYPESQNVSKVMVDFKDFGNMNGTLISNTPLENLPYAGVHFRAATKNIHHERFAEVFWPNNTALFDSKYVYQRTTSTFTTELKGSLLVEIPLATRHTGKINYNYMEKSLNKTGHASIEYNDNQLLEGNYKCVSESSAGREKDKIEIDLENEYFPLGIFYTHENRYSGGNEGTNLPTIDIKHAEVFKLNNMTAFHLTGELKIKTTHSGQDILMTAKHLQRVVTLQTDYDQKDNEFTHRSMLTLDPDSWASYDITIVNKTTDEKDEEHIDLNFAYPQRNFTVSGYYQLANNSLSSEMKFVWDKETRSVGTSLDWKRLSYKPNKQHAVFSIKHPSFIRDITLNGIYYSDDKDLINVSTDLVYSNDARKKLSLSGKIQDISQGRNKKYQYQILGSHPATRLDLNAYGGIILERGFYKTNNKASYGRSYLSTQTGELNGMVNTHEKEIDFEDYVDTFGKEVWNGFFANVEYWKNYIRSEINDSVQDIWKDAQPIIQGFLDDVEELNSLKDDFEKFKIYLNDSYNNNDFYVQDIVGFCNKLVDDLAIRAHIESLPAFVKEIWDIMGESGEAILKSLRWIIDTIKNSFQKAVDFINSLMRGDLTSKISDLMTKLVEKYDKFIKDLHVAFVKYMSDLWHKTSALLTEHWNHFVLTVEPTFVMIAHYVETIVWNVSTEVLDFLYQRKTELVESPYFSKFANFTQDLDKFYKDIMKNDIITNIRKYSKIVYEFIRDKYFAMVPFGKELEDIANEIISELKVLQKLPSINYAIEKSNELYEKIVWVYNYLDLGTRIQKAITLVHLKITDITQTALQAENRYREAKTLFIFDPDNGLVILEQKLPMSWHAFNETPRFEEIPEYKAINDLQNYFVSSNITFWTLYYEYKPYTEPSNWLPPFSGQAIIAGPQHFMTFDRSFYEFQGSCSYLLASDFVDRNFSLAISYDVKKGEHVISVIIGKEIIHIDIFNDEVTIERGENKMLPIEIGDTFIYQEASIVTVESEKGFKIQCNMKFDVCVISLSGWYFGKTAGLLGTMDNEPTSDFLTPQKILEKDIGKFAQSWALNRETCSSTKNFAVMKQTPEDALVTKCNEFFKMKSSQFSSCFSRVDSTPFLNMCLNSRDSADKDPCTVAVAYMQACTIENTPLRIPESCVKCRILVPDMEVPEGDFRQLEGNEVPKSTDVVFIVEAGSCNSNITTERSLDALLTSLSKELTGAGFTSNRYSVVVFGGDGVYNQPRSVVLNNNVFTTPEEILQYFENIPTGSGDKDIFGAIRFAAQLVFRPGVSKTFILIPCSNCNPGNMTLDYSVLHQVLLERGIQLHILMNDEFRFQKQKAQKNFYGMDRDNAYTNKDIKDLKGDSDLKRQVLLPKSKLGVCTALALETNGTVFTAKRLQGDKKNVVKKFVTVFAKRVAQTADPYPCQKCECTADNNGISYMECFPCEYPQPSQYNYNFDEDLDISAISAIADEEEADYLDEDI
ncbi:Apolipophorins, partial [Gryllus bimaculatus]